MLKNEINIKPEETILDIGSGIGRTAIALSDFMNNKGVLHLESMNEDDNSSMMK